jgi:hypothetical protein
MLPIQQAGLGESKYFDKGQGKRRRRRREKKN